MDRLSSLYLKNTTVALMLMVPWLIVAISARQPAVNDSPAEPDDQPPIISLSEANGYLFASGSAALSVEFSSALSQRIVPEILRLAAQHKCDVVEVVGHTDGQEMRGRSNLDTSLTDEVASIADLRAGSNADLGLMRAWSVVTYLRFHPELGGLQLHALSASYLVAESGDNADLSDHSDRPSRRRIEIRLRRSARTIQAPKIQ
jgi:flagellar motor protein MotB